MDKAKDETAKSLVEESEYWLARTFLLQGELESADRILAQAIANERQGYLKSRIWYEKGKIAQKQKKYPEAVENYLKAEDVVGNKSLLSPDQKLDLWIQRSLCYKDMGHLDQAINFCPMR